MPTLNAQTLLALPYEQKAEVIRRWTRKNIADTQCWNFWARDDQAEPPEDWRIWLVMAGRGYGKTRMGAEWVSKAGQIAHWVGGSWRFVVPHEGMRVWNKSTRRHSWFIAGQWTTAPSIPNPTGGATVDSEARAALVAILIYFRSIGILAT